MILANSVEEVAQLETLYGADPRRIEVVPPGVEHAFFSPGDRRGARRALGLGDHPVLLFVGRIQPLKGLPVAVGALAELHRPDAELVVVGGPSGLEGDHELQHVLESHIDGVLRERTATYEDLGWLGASDAWLTRWWPRVEKQVSAIGSVVLPDAEQVLKRLSAGSVIRKAPRDVLEARRRRRRTTVPADTVEQRAADLSGGEQQ